MTDTSPEIQKDPSQSAHIESRLETRLTKLFENFKKRIPELVGGSKMQKAGDLPSVNMDAFLKRLGILIKEEILEPGEKIIDETTKEAYQHGVRFSILQAQRVGYSGIMPPFKMSVIDTRIINNLKARSLSDLKGITEASSTQITRLMSDGLLTGRTYGEVTRDMVRTVDNVGITRARALVRTEVMRAVNTSIKTKYGQIGIEQVEFLACVDDRVCEECSGYGGQIFNIDDIPELPVHVNCRCTIVPYIDHSQDEAEQMQKVHLQAGDEEGTWINFKKGNPLSCSAYPAGIPNEILISKVNHKKPYPGDHGIQFKER